MRCLSQVWVWFELTIILWKSYGDVYKNRWGEGDEVFVKFDSEQCFYYFQFLQFSKNYLKSSFDVLNRLSRLCVSYVFFVSYVMYRDRTHRFQIMDMTKEHVNINTFHRIWIKNLTAWKCFISEIHMSFRKFTS